jgi:hypothetical protein
VQYDPEVYPPDPEAFRPERFLEGAPEPYTWIPFGGGVRRCLGAAFAQLEMKVVIRTILARTELRAATLRDDIADIKRRLDDAERTAKALPHREKYLLLAVGFLRQLLDLHLKLVDQVEQEFQAAERPTAETT